MKLSYIIPVFNTGDLVGRCVESCLDQGLDCMDFEIIIVDDGSSDDSYEKCCHLSLTYKETNIRVIRQENKGLSGARNTGISNACGEYIWFVDSDDFLEKDSIEPILKRAMTDRLDVCAFAPYITEEIGDSIEKSPFAISDSSAGRNLNGLDFVSSVDMPPAAWCSLYRRRFLLDNTLQFKEEIYYEDQEFTPRAYALAKKAAFMNVYVYNYVQRDGSIMKSNDKYEKRAKDWLSVTDSIYDFTQKNVPSSHPAYEVMMNKVCFDFSQSLRFCRNNIPSVDVYKSKPYYPLPITQSLTIRDKVKYKLINTSVSLYMLLYKMFAK